MSNLVQSSQPEAVFQNSLAANNPLILVRDSQGTQVVALQSGQALNFVAQQGNHYQILASQNDGVESLLDDLIAVREGDNLVINYANGTQLTINGYFSICAAQGEQEPDASVCSATVAGDDAAAGHTIAANTNGAAVDTQTPAIVYAHGDQQALLDIVGGDVGDTSLLATYFSSLAEPAAAATLGLPLILGGIGGAASLAGGGGGSSTDAEPALTEAGAITAISDAAKDNDASATSPSVSVYATAGVTGVDADNLQGLNNLLNTASISDQETDSKAEIQALVDGYNTIQAAADGNADNSDPRPSVADYLAVGVTGVETGPMLELVGDAVDGKNPEDVDTQEEIQTIADAAKSVLDGAAVSVISDAALANNADATTPSVSLYGTAGVSGVSETNLADINELLNTPNVTDKETDSTAEIQTLIDGYNAIQAAADDNASAPEVAHYQAIGVTGVKDDAEELALLGDVINSVDGTDVNTQQEVQDIADAVQGVMDAAAGAADSPTSAQLSALGISGVTADNLAAVQTAIANTNDDGTGVDDLSELQDLVTGAIDAFDAATAAAAGSVAIISAAAKENNATAELVGTSVYEGAAVTGVNASNLADINALLNTPNITDIETDSIAKIQSIVDGYNAIQEAADGTANNSTDPSEADYAAIGVTGVDASAEVTLLGEVIDAANGTDVNTQAQVQALADAVQSVIAGAVDLANAPTKSELEALGITGVTDDNLATVQAAIAATNPDGTEVDEFAELQALATQAAADYVAAEAAAAVIASAIATISAAAEGDTAGDDTTGQAVYEAAGVTDIDSNNLADINELLNTGNIGEDETGTTADIQALVNAYNAIQTAADGTADNNETDPSAADYAAIGVTGVDDAEELALLGDVIDASAGADVNTQAKVQTLTDAVQSVMVGAAGTADTPTKAELEALGITGVTDDNFATVQAAIAATNPDGTEVDNLAELQALIDQAETDFSGAVSVISAAAQANNASDPSLAENVYTTAGVTGVDSGNLAEINALLDEENINGLKTDTRGEIQDLVNGYSAIQAAADGTANNNPIDPTVADYAVIGVTGVDDAEEVTLLGEVVDASAGADVNTQAKVQALADAVQSVMDGAAGTASKPTRAELEALGITGVVAGNIAAIQAAVAATDNTGIGVDTIVKLQGIVDSTPALITDVLLSATGGQNDILNAEDVVSVTVTFTQAITVSTAGGTPSITIDVDGTQRPATYLSGTGSKQLVFQYTIASADNDADGIAILANSLVTHGGTITDLGGDAASLSHGGEASNPSIIIDSIAPTTSVAIDSMSDDVGASTTDFMTNDNDGLTIIATLSTGLLSGEVLYYSKDGVTWSDITSAVSDKAISYSDSGLTSSATIQFKVEDAAGNQGPVASQAVIIDVDGPVFTSSDSVDVRENSSSLASVYTATTTDAGDVTYSFTDAGVDNNLFTMSASGVVTFNERPDYENPIDSDGDNSYNISIRATDEFGYLQDQNVIVNVTDVDDAPAAVLDLGMIEGTSIHLRLMSPVVMPDGKVFYYLDADGDGLSHTDYLPHNILDGLLNGGADTIDTQVGGAQAGVDDERTVIINGYTLVLPTHDEVAPLYDLALYEASLIGWTSGNYTTSTRVASGIHYNDYFNAGVGAINDNYPDTSPAYVIFQVLSGDRDAALADIEAAAQNNNADSTIVLNTYTDLGINGVTNDNLAAINSALDSIAVTGSEADTYAKVQGIVDAYNVILNAADGVSDGDTKATQAQYTTIGVNGIDSAEKAMVLGELIDAKNNADVDTVEEVQTLADSVSGLITALAKIEAYNNGDGSDPAALVVQDYIDAGVTGVNNLNLTLVNAEVFGQSTGGADTQSKVQSLVSLAVSEFTINDVQIERGGFMLKGFQNASSLGTTVSNAGDVNGDGIDDMIVGLSFYDGPTSSDIDSGAAAVVYGREDHSLVDLSDIFNSAESDAGFIIHGVSSSNRLGEDVSAAGDVNGDDFDDLITIAKSTETNSLTSAGAAYLVYGKANNDDVKIANIEAEVTDSNGRAYGFAMYGESTNDGLSMKAISAGDVNGDGLGDMLVSSQAHNSSSGITYVVFGRDSNEAFSLGSSVSGYTINGVYASHSGSSVSNAGDINGDGLDDLIIGAKNTNSVNGTLTGATYVVFGKADASVIALSDIDNNNTNNGVSYGYKIIGASAQNAIGHSVSNAGDVNGDGISDLIIGSQYGDRGAYVVYGKANDTNVIDLATVATDASDSGGFFIKGTSTSAGTKVSGIGDINGDGLDDVMVSDVRATANGVTGSGAVYVVYGRTDGTQVDLLDIEAGNEQGLVISGAYSAGSFGYSLSGAGDINGDGFDDMILGYTNFYDALIGRTGSAYVVYGGLTTSATVGTADADTMTGDATANQLVAGLGDDLLQGLGGADVMRGGAGNDVMAISDDTFANLDGGLGIDTLRLDTQFTLDLTAVANNRLQNVEVIDLNDQGSTLVLALGDVLSMVGSEAANDLRLMGGSADTVDITSTGFVDSGVDQVIDSVSYDVYRDANLDDSVSLLIEQGLIITI